MKHVTLLFLLFLASVSAHAQLVTFNGQGNLVFPPGAPAQTVGIIQSPCPVSGIGTIGGCVTIEQVDINLTHTWVGDIAIFLLGPGGQALEFSTGNGGGGDNFTNTVYQYLAERKGMSYDQSREMHENVVSMAKKVGLDYNFDIAVIANSFDAHRLVQFAKTKNLGDAAEEMLFKAYFTEGKDVADHQTLAELGATIGLEKNEVLVMLRSDTFADAVDNDILEAQRLGLRGVPFFVMDRKYGVSGAQPAEAFLQTLNKSYEDWRKEHPVLEMQKSEGAVCTPDGECD